VARWLLAQGFEPTIFEPAPNELAERERRYWSLVEAAVRQSNSHDGF